MSVFWGAFLGSFAGWLALGVLSLCIGGKKNGE